MGSHPAGEEPERAREECLQRALAERDRVDRQGRARRRSTPARRRTFRLVTERVARASIAGVDDDELLSRARRDPSAFGTFYERHERLVLGYFMRRTQDPELAADLAAETFAVALVAARKYRGDGAPASAWLVGIARNTLFSSLRRSQVEDRARRR